jgi:hypothetical protein
MCRQIFTRDFKIITVKILFYKNNVENILLQKTCVRCFPKQYDIVNRFLDYYHNCLKEHLTEICDPKRRSEGDTLTTAEVYTIVTFVRDYQ